MGGARWRWEGQGGDRRGEVKVECVPLCRSTRLLFPSSVQSSATAEESSTPPSSSTYHHFALPVGGLPPGEHHQGDVLVQAPPRHAQLTWDWLYYYVPSEEIKGMR